MAGPLYRAGAATMPGRLIAEAGKARGVNLRALQPVGEVHVERLPLRVEINRRYPGLAVTVAGLLGAAKGQVGLGADGGRVDVNDARVEIAHGLEGPIDVAGVDGGRKAIGHAVRDFEGLFEVVARDHGNHRAEDLFLRDAHLRVAIRKHSGLVKPAAGVRAALQAVPAGDQLSSFVRADLDILHHRVELRLIDAGPHLGAGPEAVADL